LSFFFFEECENIVYEAHTSKIPYHGMNATQNIINERGWLVGSPHYGTPNKYIREFCLQCPLCSSKKRPSPIKRKKYHYDEVIHVLTDRLDERLKDLILEHKVILFLFL